MSESVRLILHERTAAQLSHMREQPSHAIAIVGNRGVGKRSIAESLAAELLHETPTSLANHPYVLQVNTVEQTIPIEDIRKLQQFTRLKTVGTATVRRIIVLLGAGGMTTEAQNAFLKLLEEPPADTVLILTVENESALLPTIMSRVQKVVVHPVPEAEVRAHFGQAFDPAAVDKAFFLSGGLPGLMHALLEGATDHPLLPAVTTAKEILQQKTFERLAHVDALSKKKDELPYVLQALRQIASTGRNQASKQQDQAKIKRWHQIIKATYDAETALTQSANAKLVLTNLMLAF